MKDILTNIQTAILLFIILFHPPGSTFLAIFSITILQLMKNARAVPCKIKKDLSNKVALITGGNTGIGKQTALELARQGCQVIIAARDTAKSAAAAQEIIQQTKNTKVSHYHLDLGSIKSIQEFTGQIKAKYQKINYLVNNAGVMMIPERRLTTDGFEMQVGINHLGHFLLTSKLWDLLRDVPNLRIINVSSSLHHKTPTIDFQNYNLERQYAPRKAYAYSKLSNVLFSQELAERLAKINPTARCVSLHPGVIRTELLRYVFEGKEWMKYLALPLTYVLFKSPEEGAQTTLYTVLAGKGNVVNGEYYQDSQVSKKNGFARVPENQKKLWAKSEELLKIKFEAN